MSKYISADKFSYRYKNLEIAANNCLQSGNVEMAIDWSIRRDERADVQHDLIVFPGIEIVFCKNCVNRHTDECPMCHEEWVSYADDGYIETDNIVNDYSDDNGFCYLGKEK